MLAKAVPMAVANLLLIVAPIVCLDFLYFTLFCYAVLSVRSRFATISLRKSEIIALL